MSSHYTAIYLGAGLEVRRKQKWEGTELVPSHFPYRLKSGGHFRIHLGIFSRFGGIGRQTSLRHLCGDRLLARVFSLKLQPQLSLDAGMRRDDFAIGLSERFRQFTFVNRPGRSSFPPRVAAFDETDRLVANSTFHRFFPRGGKRHIYGGETQPTLTCSRSRAKEAATGLGAGASSGSERQSTSTRNPSVSFCSNTSWPLLKRIASRYRNGSAES